MKKQLKNHELSAFASQLTLILHSGISLLEGVSILKEDAQTKEEQELLNLMYEKLDETGDFSLFLKVTRCFPDYFLKMTELGERSGNLEEVMDALSGYYSRQDTLIKNIRDALTYPLVLLCMLTAVLAVLITQVMPVFEEVFTQLGIDMSGMAHAVFRMGSVLQKSSAVLLVLVIAAAVFALYATRSLRGKEILLKVFRKISLSRMVLFQISLSRFSHALAIALHSGMDMTESLSIASEFADTILLGAGISKSQSYLEEGSDLGNALKDSGLFTGLHGRLVSIGFRTGSAETALFDISESCQKDAEESIEKAVSAIEPILTAFLSVLTGMILVSVMLPLLGVMANIG